MMIYVGETLVHLTRHHRLNCEKEEKAMVVRLILYLRLKYVACFLPSVA